MRLLAWQMAALSAASRERFLRQIERHVREFFPERTLRLDAPALRRRIERTIEHASGYGLSIEADLATYVLLTFKLGEDFEEAESFRWAKDLLTSRFHPPSYRIERLDAAIHGLIPEGEPLVGPPGRGLGPTAGGSPSEPDRGR